MMTRRFFFSTENVIDDFGIFCLSSGESVCAMTDASLVEAKQKRNVAFEVIGF
jgi:hypothetical protein